MSPNDFQAELQKARYEPLLPIEKKLIGWSSWNGAGAFGRLGSDQSLSAIDLLRRGADLAERRPG